MPTNNLATNITIVGAGGHAGATLATAIVATGKHKVTAITRPDSTTTLPSGLHEVKKIDYSDQSALTNALQGQDVLLLSLAIAAEASTIYKFIDAAIAADVRFIMPNEWGGDVTDEVVSRATLTFEKFDAVRKYVETNGKGKTSWIGCACGFWYEFSLAGTYARYGFDFEKKKLTLYNDGHLKIDTTTWSQMGRAIANLLSLPIDRDDQVGGDRPVISDWANSSIRFSSFFVDQLEMFESVLRVSGDRREDWTVDYEGIEDRYNRGKQLLQQGKPVGFCLQLYARRFYEDSPTRDPFQDNAKLGLPKEDIDEYTKVGMEMAARGETNSQW